ncbi:MAG TPA: hypothetical protein VFE78_17730 [Gemmataceae bacterium]|nr:hypothetical protein [Gemmataceae bacterium]
MNRNSGWVVLGLVGLMGPARADAQAPASPDPAAALAGSLRGLLIESIPTPLYEDTSHWGKQSLVAGRTRWRGKGLQIHPEVEQVLKNDGRWWKVRVTAAQPAQSLALDVRDVQRPEPGRMLFTALLATDADVVFDRQTWKQGVRFYSGSTRARLRVKLALRCEAVTRIEGGKLLPEAVFRLRVLQADVGYDNFVVEHIAGVGGDAAKLMGEAAHGALRRLRPSLERRLLDKANTAIVKAGDTKEVRVSLLSLLHK